MSSASGVGGERARFPVPHVNFADDTWCPSSVPEKFQNMPFAPFSKGERLGKVADFGGYVRLFAHNRWYRGGRDENAEIGYRHDRGADQSFELVDSTKVVKRKSNQKRRPRKDAPVAGDRGWEDKSGTMLTRHQQKILHQGASLNKRKEKLNRAKFESRKRTQHVRVHREASVRVSNEWNHLEQYDLSQLSKLQTAEPSATDLKWCGTLAKYNDKYDRISSKSKQRLVRYENRDFFYVTAREDPIIQQLSEEEVGNVFATEAVLAHLMTCPRSVFPWDIVITYLAGTVFLDVRDALGFEMHSVNETARNPPPEGDDTTDDINGRDNLELEATAIHQNFTQQVLNGPVSTENFIELEENPFWDEEDAEKGHEPARLAYRYRKWQLGNGINLVGRTTVNAVTTRGDQRQFMTCFALNEYDPKVSNTTPWRSSIDTQRGALIAQEVQNNGFKLAKWTAASQLAGAEQMKIGFVSRGSSKNPDSHVVLGTQMYPPDMFAHQLSLSSVNMWGIIKWLVELVRKHAANFAPDDEDELHVCKFVLLKDPNQSTVSLYAVPMETFEDEDGSEEDSDDESADDDSDEEQDE